MSMDLIDIGNGMMMISGPTYMNRYCNMMMNNNNVASGCAGGVGVGQSLDDARSKQQQQPFESFTKSPGGSGLRGMAQASSSIGVFFPFTNAQWKELERQAMVFKYMMHSIPVPYDLLFPFISSPSTDPSGMMIRRDTNLLKLMKNGDPEPGRCRRTDGKKWRCANAVAIDQKYCEKHVHRGRPRSRKHVEAPPPAAASASNLIHKKPRLCPQVSVPKLTSCPQTVASSNHGAFQLHLRNEDLSDGQWQPLMQFPKQDETQHDLVSLGLSMGHVSYNNEDLSDDKTNQEETHDWLSRLGGPLGEVLRPPLTPSPTTTNAASSSTSCNVLHEANGSVSDGA